MTRWRATLSLAVALIAGTVISAMAQPPPDAEFDGVARIGSDTRTVRFRFFCSANEGPGVTGVLSVELEVPRYEEMRAMFDFDPFEGPDANAGPLSALQATGARGKASGQFTASGSAVGDDAPLSFQLEVTASRRETGSIRKLGAVLGPLTEGPSRMVWRQGNAKQGGTPLIATMDLTAAQADRLRTAIGPCLNRR